MTTPEHMITPPEHTYRVNPRVGGDGYVNLTLPSNAPQLEDYLNDLAKEGWLLDCTVRGADGADMLVFIRADFFYNEGP